MSIKIHEIVTERIITMLESGTVPWRKPFTGVSMTPKSLANNKPYRGVNRFLLDPTYRGYTSPFWGTYKQVAERGGQVRKGEKSSIAVFFTMLEDKKNPGKKKFPMLRYFSLFNVDQCDGLKLPKYATPAAPATPFCTIQRCDDIVAGYENAPKILHNGGDRCFYSPGTDTISMADKSSFTPPESYYRTLFHEMVHSTGHPTRKARKLCTIFGSPEYAREELVAELGAAFLCEEGGISSQSEDGNSAAYLANWIKCLKADSKAVVTAAGAAQKATDHILGVKWNEETPAVEEVATA